ncbi:sialate O-acetylesterase [uncultured Duncaniella sp.]|mgnify:CR=1 FL=1|uniref:sialate O-acetylesterase n=1 Tax=uncultured Duncaniella sp. TaxID=2768039 RepID=UPI0025CD6792|nr:sialate O-acetylesterase [uncultured Duncaniella sp.]
MKTQIITLAVILSTVGFETKAKVRPASMITDNMVLQQNANARIYGTADPGSTVTVTPSWDGKAYTTTTDRTGEWSLAVKTPAGSFTPYTITLSDGEPLTINNVLIGEVWLASGQSNMQMPLKGFPGCCTLGGYDEIASASDEAGKVRFFTVPLTQSYTPLDTVAASWTVPSPDTAPEYSALAWHFAKRMSDVLNVPVGIVSAAYGGAKVESWTPRDMLEKYPDVSLDPKDIEPIVHYHRPMLMYNAMFNPIKNYTYNGIIWYQGCSNVATYDTYAERLAAMVKRWRDDIGIGDIPFYAVEIAPYEYGDPTEKGKAPLLREAQWKAVGMIPNSAMISTNDLVEPYERFNIHPADKAAVGKRLCDLALNKTYGKKQFPIESPRYKSHRFMDGAAWVAIDSPSDGICRNYMIEGFEVAGADRVFHPADSVWLHWQTNEMVVSSKNVPDPVAVRYGWRDFLPGNLHAGNYLPLIPFRTDDWE